MPSRQPRADVLDLGALIRGGRNSRRPRMTQAQLGRLLGYSESWVSRVEANEITPPREILLSVANILDFTPEQLGLVRPARPPAPETSGAVVPGAGTTTEHVSKDREDDAVRRRHFLAGAVGLGAAMATGPAAAAVARTGPAFADPAAALEAALFQPPAAEPLPLDRLALALAAARGDFAGARYESLSEELPRLIATAEATRDSLAPGLRRDRAHAMVARAYVLASGLAVKIHSETAWVSADRALRAARAGGHAAPLGEAARVLAITMRRAGRGHAAVDLLTRTATSLDGERGAASAGTLAVRTSLLLTAAYSAARCGDRAGALALADEAERAAARLPADPVGGLFTVEATAQQCALYRVSVFNALGTPDEGVEYARRLEPAKFPTAERRARCFTDTARMWHQLGDHRRTYAALRSIERQAPEEARRPSVRALTTDLVYAPVSLPGLKEFAIRTGAVHG
ncbi:helix-turn-helix transcriptional regulator [Streptomyces sp. AK02-01A]|uniref:helix-turn-helix domain-containing protein n=1 Tax=Streptomyces sp. AK02-01A TaxID=3028648 RepID=UPI0029CA5B67|nr:helix-turn-helix transcriptional regulator [Streptomyces sp. AK02-01A]